jgi:hypothetical protein
VAQKVVAGAREAVNNQKHTQVIVAASPNAYINYMVEKSDWRLQGQERYLKDVTLLHQHYHKYAKNSNWDHDHCSFCGKKFMVENYPDVLHQGYSTTDDYYWICENCFEDFHEMFNWSVIECFKQDDIRHTTK